MIEMLGVLAVIGVLSAGGIMGYSAAMDNYKVNKFIDNIVQVSVNLNNFFKKSPPQSDNIFPSKLCQINILPKEWCGNNIVGDGYIINTISLDDAAWRRRSIYLFVYDYTVALGIYVDGKFSRSHCVKLVTYPWLNTLKMAKVTVGEVTTDLPMTMQQAQVYCDVDKRMIFHLTVR